MLDENLPTFHFTPSPVSPLSTTIYETHDGCEPNAEYTITRPDPSLPAARNRYAIALYDSYSPEILYAEVLVQPEWTHPTLSQTETRSANGVAPPPVPIVPDRFTIQLYNPDQQVTIKQVSGSWNSSAYWGFDLPQNSFRIPSASALDRSQSDPLSSDLTPRVSFKWKRDGKLNKDISCYLVGKSTDGRKHKEPDITIAMFKGGKDLLLYQPNMHRVEVEDFKGLELILILGAAVIKDIFFNGNREMFNIHAPNTNRKRSGSGPVLKARRSSLSLPLISATTMTGGLSSSPPAMGNVPESQIFPNASRRRSSRPPPTDPRTQWEIDQETARLKTMVEAEERDRDLADRLETERIKKMLESEEKESRRREAEIAKETERLRKKYGVVELPPPAPPSNMHPVQRPLSTVNMQSQGNSPYLQTSGGRTAAASLSGFFGGNRNNNVTRKRSGFF